MKIVTFRNIEATHNMKNMFRSLSNQARFSYQYSDALTPVSGASVILAYLASYLVEQDQGVLHFNTLPLRVSISTLILIMIFRDFWLPMFGRWRDLVWVAFIGTILPYCFGSILILDAAFSPEQTPVNLFPVTEYVISSFFLVQLLFHLLKNLKR